MSDIKLTKEQVKAIEQANEFGKELYEAQRKNIDARNVAKKNYLKAVQEYNKLSVVNTERIVIEKLIKSKTIVSTDIPAVTKAGREVAKGLEIQRKAKLTREGYEAEQNLRKVRV